MLRMLPILLSAVVPLCACAPASVPQDPPAAALPAPAAGQDATAPAPGSASASIVGAIRDGNRPSPALRICAHPASGGVPTCTQSSAGATGYRIGLEPGRYFLMGWVQGGELTLIAHAMQIRCIQAPCPPDELIEVEVAAGEEKTDIDLSAGYVAVPAGWPAKPH